MQLAYMYNICIRPPVLLKTHALIFLNSRSMKMNIIFIIKCNLLCVNYDLNARVCVSLHAFYLKNNYINNFIKLNFV